MPKDVRVNLTHYDIRPHTELQDILCDFVNENKDAISKLLGGDNIPRKIHLSKPIDEIIALFARKFFEATNARGK